MKSSTPSIERPSGVRATHRSQPPAVDAQEASGRRILRFVLRGSADPNINDDGFNTFRDLLSPEYGLYDKLNWARGVLDAGNVMFPQLWKADVDLRRDAPVLQVPVYFLIGRHDVNASPVLAEEYYRLLQTPRKAWVWFERSGHNPWVTEADRFMDVVVNTVLQQTQPAP